ncbi:hypothetical protein BJX61DRAFT_490491 [Aspergillus egyptiacus]|nr:hypothetical protein BJX61DRAFT_490491 [Aspergillus egyptiacus]
MIGAQPSSFPFQSQQTPTATPTLPVWNSMNSITPATFAPYQPNYAPGPAGINPQWPQLPQLPSLPQVPVMPPLPQLPLFPQLPQLPQAAPTASRQATATNQLFVPSYFQDAIYHKSLEDATKQYDALSAQLSQIDRFTAMHAWVIDPETKKLLVEQRKSLVRELDTVRLYKEHLQLLFGKNQMKGTPGAQKETIRVPVTPSRNEAWDTPTKSKSRSLSPTVRNLYRTIEETDERGEPIDGLLRALSGASKVLAKKLGEERKRPLGVPAKEPPKELSDTFIKAKEEPAPEGPEKAEYAQPVQTSRKLWQSDPYPHSPLISQCFNKDWSPVLQKSAAPAVSQNVTAHAFLRSLDGAGKVTDDFELV